MKILAAVALVLVALMFQARGGQVPGSEAADPGPDPVVVAKVEPAALKAALTTRTARVVVRLRNQATFGASSGNVNALAERSRVVSALQSVSASSQRGVVSLLETRRQSGAVLSYRTFWIFNGIAAEVDYQTLLDLAKRPEVESIRLDRRRTLLQDSFAPPRDLEWIRNPTFFPLAQALGHVAEPSFQVSSSTTEWNLLRIQADRVWNGLGVTGKGVVVAIMDSGVDWLHPALASSYRGYSPRGLTRHSGNWTDVTSESFAYPGDGFGHGTMVTGIVLGRSDSSVIGVAPGAQWIGVKTFDNTGSTFDSWLHAGFQWILAPEGDPKLAPQIVSASWGKDIPGDTALRDDLRALRAAGILPVFAAGNFGPTDGSIASPASLPETFAVGASDSLDLVANFSGRGPSPFGVTKPDVIAPGVDVRTSVPGGGYRLMKGTSASTPHVSGLAALLLEAKPAMTITETEQAIIAGTFRTGYDVPSDKAGWGRIDAYASVAAAANAGILAGRVTGSDGIPVSGASVMATNESTSATISARSASDGTFDLSLRAGSYRVSASAFGYDDRFDYRVGVTAGITSEITVALPVKPRARISGRVVDLATGSGLTATVTLISGTWSTTTAAPGSWALDVPLGTYTLRATAPAHRAVRREITVEAGGRSDLTLALPVAPTILLVDSGVWYSDSRLAFWQDGLDTLDYVYATRQITDVKNIPTADELRQYDLVIWSAPQDSPGLVGAQSAVVKYLDGGGRLLVSGQDVGFWDGGINLGTFYPYFRQYLHADAIADNAGTNGVAGLTLEPFAGLTVTLNTEDSARNQFAPDVIQPRDGRAATVLAYATGEGAALRVNVCLPYRVMYFGFGWEGSGPRANRIRLLGAAIDWLLGQDGPQGYRVDVDRNGLIAGPGQAATAQVSVWNTGRSAETFDVTVRTGRWSASVLDQAGMPATSVGTIGGCETATAQVRVAVPYDTTRSDSDVVTVTVAPRSSPSLATTRTLSARPPGIVLLVDDSRFYDVRGSYARALDDVGLSHDLWQTSSGPPPEQLLATYPIVLWYTGYDWYDPVTPADEVQLGNYLDGGGRLLLTSQDYLYRRGGSDFSINRLGVLTYTTDITAFAVSGVVDAAVGGNLGTAKLTTPYPEWSDVITPTESGQVVLRNRDGGNVGIARYDRQTYSKSLFLSFPFDGLDRRAAAQLLRSAVSWFSVLSASTFAAERAWVEAGADVSFALLITNAGSEAIPVNLTNALPAALQLQVPTLQGASADLRGERVTWSGTLAPGETKLVRYRTRLVPSYLGTVTNVAVLESPGQTPLLIRARVAVPYRLWLPFVPTGKSTP